MLITRRKTHLCPSACTYLTQTPSYGDRTLLRWSAQLHHAGAWICVLHTYVNLKLLRRRELFRHSNEDSLETQTSSLNKEIRNDIGYRELLLRGREDIKLLDVRTRNQSVLTVHRATPFDFSLNTHHRQPGRHLRGFSGAFSPRRQGFQYSNRLIQSAFLFHSLALTEWSISNSSTRWYRSGEYGPVSLLDSM